MKKLFLFLAVVSAASFASCKKSRSCTCTGTSNSTEVTTWDNSSVVETQTTSTPSNYAIIFTEAKKKDAKKACIDSSSEDVYSYDSSGINPSGNFDTNTIVTTTKNEDKCELN